MVPASSSGRPADCPWTVSGIVEPSAMVTAANTRLRFIAVSSSSCLSGRLGSGWRHCTDGGRLRDRKRQPGVPAGRPVGGVELAISLQPDKGLVAADREDISELRADAENA